MGKEKMIYNGDCLEILPTLAEGSVHCCVTSPPYYGLRDYGTAKWDGGDSGCDHKKIIKPSTEHIKREGYTDAFRNSDSRSNHFEEPHYKNVCGKCGATRIDSQLGLESTLEEYLGKMVAVFREVKRVLRKDGTCWVNMGDSYGQNQGKGFDTNQDGGERKKICASPKIKTGLKPKDLMGVPWRLAFALQADGWYLRSDIIWHKPNPMPESVTDRPTKSHEYLFLLTKSQKYYYDQEAVREKMKEESAERYKYSFGGKKNEHLLLTDNQTAVVGDRTPTNGRNLRTVWTIATQPFPEAHFATFPKKLVEPCILAGSPVGGTVLDPFSGSGTTGLVAYEHGREFIGIELSPEYVKMAERRLGKATEQGRLFA
jgi:DNA modification methylase